MRCMHTDAHIWSVHSLPSPQDVNVRGPGNAAVRTRETKLPVVTYGDPTRARLCYRVLSAPPPSGPRYAGVKEEIH